MKSVIFATCRAQPELTPSDAVLAAALARRGIDVQPAPWNGDFAPFARADMTVIRSTWDYFSVPIEFARWLDALSGLDRVFNPPELMRWNMGKTYLFELAGAGVQMASLRPTEPTAAAIAEAMDALGLEEAIVKPIIGGTASGLSRVNRARPGDLTVAAKRLGGPGLVQAFVPEIVSHGETSLIFFDGVFSHAVLKTPKAGDIRVQEDHGGASKPVNPPLWALAEAEKILTMCPLKPLYARVDAVLLDEAMLLMEIELVEPELFFTYCPDAADRFADALENRL